MALPMRYRYLRKLRLSLFKGFKQVFFLRENILSLLCVASSTSGSRASLISDLSPFPPLSHSHPHFHLSVCQQNIAQ